MRLLFVCTGNICRSPMAEGITRAAIERNHPERPVSLEVASAGIAGLDGEEPTSEAVRAMEERGIDIRGYEAQTVSRKETVESDLVMVMEERHKSHVSALAGRAVVPVFLLLKLAEAVQVVLKAEDHGLDRVGPLESLESVVSVATVMERNDSWELPLHQYEVADPMGMPLEWYRRAADIMEVAIGDILRALLGPVA